MRKGGIFWNFLFLSTCHIENSSIFLSVNIDSKLNGSMEEKEKGEIAILRDVSSSVSFVSLIYDDFPRDCSRNDEETQEIK